MRKRQEQIDSGLEMSNSKLNEEIKKRKKAEREAEKLKAQLEFAKKNKFGDKRQKVKRDKEGKPCEENPDRNDEKDNFDGTDDTLETKSVSEPSDVPESKKEKDLSNCPDMSRCFFFSSIMRKKLYINEINRIFAIAKTKAEDNINIISY